MSLLKFFLSRTAPTDSALPESWRRDPLNHPDLARMSGRELADLPLSPVPQAPQGTTTVTPARPSALS